jgi:hypothetical protein
MREIGRDIIDECVSTACCFIERMELDDEWVEIGNLGGLKSSRATYRTVGKSGFDGAE